MSVGYSEIKMPTIHVDTSSRYAQIIVRYLEPFFGFGAMHSRKVTWNFELIIGVK